MCEKCLIEYKDFENMLNKRLFDGSRAKLLENIAVNPDRFIGLFRPTKPTTKLIQNLTQSHEIKFGDALEEVFTKYFELTDAQNLPKRIAETASGDVFNIDQLFKFKDVIYMIEQKVRDDHDSTKKRGQFGNFENKYFEVTQKYPDEKIVPIMWFIDDTLVKNKRYYIEEMKKMDDAHKCESKLCYGAELFDGTAILGMNDVVWQETLSHLKTWKTYLPDMPEINFDKNSDEVIKEIKNLKPSVFRMLFGNDEIREQILPILFPDGATLCKLLEVFKGKSEPVFAGLSGLITVFLKRGSC